MVLKAEKYNVELHVTLCRPALAIVHLLVVLLVLLLSLAAVSSASVRLALTAAVFNRFAAFFVDFDDVSVQADVTVFGRADAMVLDFC